VLRIATRRIGVSLLTLFVASAIIFWAVSLLPGNSAQQILGRNATVSSLAVLKAELHLNQPIFTRYIDWLGNFAVGHWGTSLAAQQPVLSYISTPLKNTLILGLFVLVLYVPLCLLIGVLSAWRRGGVTDLLFGVTTILGMAIPDFVLSILLLFVVGVKLKWLPPISSVQPGTSFGGYLKAIIMPGLALTAGMVAYTVRMMREGLIEAFESESVIMARLKGLPTWRVIIFHALPQALGPALNITALNVAYLIGGVVVVETIFNYPGVGSVLVNAVTYRDVPVVEAVALIMAAIYIGANLIADMLGMLLNPQLRHGDTR
jgi:peptide/nickel transport system permease protein